MAWIQNLSGQAEKFLNKIDQKAADVLNDSNLTRKTNSKISFEETEPLNNHSVSSEYEERKELEIQTEQETKNEQIEIYIPEEFEKISSNSPARSFTKEDEQLEDRTSTKSESVSNSFSLAEDIQKYVEKISKLEFENDSLSKQSLNLQHLYSEIRNENSLLKNNLERANETISAAENEMEQYKIRAYKMLQEKEKLINLKSEPPGELSEENNYIDELKNELKFQQDKNDDLKVRISNYTMELTSLQQQYTLMQDTFQQKIQSVENQFINEKRTRKLLEDDAKSKTQEVSKLRHELLTINNEMLIKAQEIDRLKRKIHESSSISNDEELESRIQALTQTLMLKQNKLEAVTCERNALKIQLEKLENEYQKHLTSTRNSQQRIIHVNDTDDVKLQIPHMMRITPTDAGVTKRVKHAYSSLDSLSIRTGVFLRRYPGIRVFVFCYMILLHLWVVVILLNYAPSTK